MTFLYLEAEARVFARDRAGQFVEAFKRIVGDVKVEGRDVHFVRIDHSVVGEVAQCSYVWRRFVKIVHTFIETGMRCRLDG